jgi:hypothetical protein
MQSELGHWMYGSPRFAGLVAENQDKIRKKLNTANGEDARLDVRAELLVAYLLLTDRRFELALETYAARQAGPDLTVTFRENQRFNLEVTRIRNTQGDVVARAAGVIANKLRQLPNDLPNALVMVAESPALQERTLAEAARAAGARTDAPEVQAHYPRLSGVLALDESAEDGARRSAWWANPQARRPLASEATKRLITCMAYNQ